MKLNILIFYPGNFCGNPSSGEIEARVLLWGFQLAGHKADTYGIESEDLQCYDLYCVFTLDNESKKFINKLPSNSKVIIFPNIDELSNDNLDGFGLEIRSGVKFASKSRNELKQFERVLAKDRLLNCKQWFLAPFQFHKSPELFSNSYDLLIMAEFERLGAAVELVDLFGSSDRTTLILTNSKESIAFGNSLSNSKGLTIKPRLRFGSADWYKYLTSVEYFYEPNNRVTSSLLERLWCSKTVIVNKGSNVLEDLSMPLNQEAYDENFIVLNKSEKKYLYKYHVDVVVRNLIEEVFLK